MLFARTLITALLVITTGAQAAPLLRCQVTYAGATQVVEARVSQDPYSIESVDIGGRFRFKAVMIGKGEQIEYIKLYGYFQQRRKDIPIHQATYLPPYPKTSKPILLTPFNQLYAGEIERELQYQCTLEGTQP